MVSPGRGASRRMRENMKQPNTLVVDRTHLGRRASGIERITAELFSAEALRPLPVEGMEASGGRLAIAACQMLRIPAAMMARPNTVWAFSGFPPSPLATTFRERCVMYVHDLFLLTRPQDLNRAAKFYMAYPFRVAIQRLRYFLVNSVATGEALAPFVRADAEVVTYRPRVRNVFDLRPRVNVGDSKDGPLIVGAMGTVEPRKNFLAAAAVCAELAAELGREVELHVVGRPGWGTDYESLGRLPHVKLHGFLPDADARTVIESFDLFLCTSQDEGLGLPLLEAQYAGLPVVAPDQPIFKEVLSTSGTFIDPASPAASAATIARFMQTPDWREHAVGSALGNIERWNGQAEADHDNVLRFLSRRLDGLTA